MTASRYSWVRLPQVSLTRLSDAELRIAPNVGDDPLRTIARLPGAVGSDLSAKINMRGGATDETLVRFDGVRLHNPFHLKDFQSIFSAINPALVGAADIYTMKTDGTDITPVTRTPERDSAPDWGGRR